MIFSITETPGSITARSGPDGRLRVADLRQLQEGNPGLLTEVATYFAIDVARLLRAASEGQLSGDVRYGAVNIRIAAVDPPGPGYRMRHGIDLPAHKE